jgi:hypothetical protein
MFHLIGVEGGQGGGDFRYVSCVRPVYRLTLSVMLVKSPVVMAVPV